MQAYAPSKKIIVRGKSYDPTMRVFFFSSHNAGIASVIPIGAYWKIPAKSLDEVGTLTEKHITHPAEYKRFLLNELAAVEATIAAGQEGVK